MFDKYIFLWLYVLVRFLGVLFFLISVEKGYGVCFIDRMFFAILFVCCAGTERFLKVGNARFFLCLNAADLLVRDFMTLADGRCLPGNGNCWMSEYIIDKVKEFLQELLPSMGLELFDIQFRREGHGWVLRVFVDADEGVGHEHCSRVSRELSYYLDIEDLIEQAYHLEVSSPGLERPLRSVADFCRFTGGLARVKLSESREGQKVFEGIIERVSENTIDLRLKDKALVQFPFEAINKARLAI